MTLSPTLSPPLGFPVGYAIADGLPQAAWDFAGGIGYSAPLLDLADANGYGTYNDGAGTLRYRRQNHIRQSQNPAAAVWTKTGVTVGPETTLGPNGEQVAKMVEVAVSSQHCYTESLSGSTIPIHNFGFSIKIKDGGRRFARLDIGDGATGNLRIHVDLTLGTVYSPATGGAWANNVATIEPISNGFFLVTLAGLKANGASNQTVMVCGVDAGTNTSYLGEVDKGLFVTDFQHNAGPIQPHFPTGATEYFGLRDQHHEFDGVSWEPVGLLRENEGETFTFPSQLGAGHYNVGAIFGVVSYPVVTASATIAPDGSTDVDRLTWSNTILERWGTDETDPAMQIPDKNGDAVVSLWMRLVSGPASDISLVLRSTITANVVSVTPTLTSVFQRVSLTRPTILGQGTTGWYLEGDTNSVIEVWGYNLLDDPKLTSFIAAFTARQVRTRETITFPKAFNGYDPTKGRWVPNYRPQTDGQNLALGYVLFGEDTTNNRWALRCQESGTGIQPQLVVGNGTVVAGPNAGIRQTPDVDNIVDAIYGPDSAQMILNGTAGAPSATGYVDGDNFTVFEIFKDVPHATMKSLAYYP